MTCDIMLPGRFIEGIFLYRRIRVISPIKATASIDKETIKRLSLVNYSAIPSARIYGVLPYIFNKKNLDTIQQVYSEENRYIISAYQNHHGIKGIIYVDSLLGIKKAFDYVPSSTISAIISQCCGLALWAVLRSECDDPTDIYNKIVEDEKVGFKKENIKYLKRIPRGKEIDLFIKFKHVHKIRDKIVIFGNVIIDKYLIADILGFIS